MPENLDRRFCFYCEHYYHVDPDDDSCRKHHSIVFWDTPACKDFSPEEVRYDD